MYSDEKYKVLHMLNYKTYVVGVYKNQLVKSILIHVYVLMEK